MTLDITTTVSDTPRSEDEVAEILIDAYKEDDNR